jgi:4-aminobutyrate aminotransferase
VEDTLEAWINRDSNSIARRYRFPSLMIKKAAGIYLVDVNNKRYLDFTSGGQTANLGHSHPFIISAVESQLEKTGVAPLGWILNDVRIQLAETLKKVAPGRDRRVGFCNTGSDATELAWRIAAEHTSRPMAICHFGCYHGQTSMGALAMNTSPDGRNYGVPQVSGVFYTPYPYCFRCLFKLNSSECGFACLDFFEYQLNTRVIPEERVCAFFFEPIQVHGGVIPLPDGYLRRLADLCHSRGILLVADEVTTGFGRTGRMFGVEHWNVDVDIIYMAKSMASGLSLGAVLAERDIMSSFRGGGTFSGNPVACAASLASISVIQEKKLLEHSTKSGEYLKKRLAELTPVNCSIGEIRGKGLLLGIELILGDGLPAKEETRRIIETSAKEGLLMFPAGAYQNVIRLCPPLTIEMEEIDDAITIIERAFKE